MYIVVTTSTYLNYEKSSNADLTTDSGICPCVVTRLFLSQTVYEPALSYR